MSFHFTDNVTMRHHNYDFGNWIQNYVVAAFTDPRYAWFCVTYPSYFTVILFIEYNNAVKHVSIT